VIDISVRNNNTHQICGSDEGEESYRGLWCQFGGRIQKIPRKFCLHLHGGEISTLSYYRIQGNPLYVKGGIRLGDWSNLQLASKISPTFHRITSAPLKNSSLMFSCPSQKHPLAHSTQPPSNSGLLQVTAHNAPSTGAQSNGQLELRPSVITHTQCWKWSWWHWESRLVLCSVWWPTSYGPRDRWTVLRDLPGPETVFLPAVYNDDRWSTQPTIQFVPNPLPPGIKQPGCESDHSPPSSAGVNNRWIYMSTPTYVWTARFLIKHNEDLYLYPLPSIIYCHLQTDSPACPSFKP
jgi:hypothetical protein